MSEIEGVIKYRLDFVKVKEVTDDLSELNCWRSILHQLKLIGQDASRYQGFGFGNLSQRCQTDHSQFIISGTQTGNLVELQQQHYVCVEHCDIAQNHLSARGPLKPSSEALTHSMFYQLDSTVKSVIHIHSAELWFYGLQNNYPSTAQTVEFGTQQMTAEVARLYYSGSLEQTGTLIMAGHQDGVICFGDSVDQAGRQLIKLWVNANQK